MITIGEFAAALGLALIGGVAGGEKSALDIRTSDINRPGLQLSGYFDHYPHDRVQVMGRSETTFFSCLKQDERVERAARIMEYEPPCLVVCRGLQCPPELLACAQEYGVPVFSSPMVTTRFTARLIAFINNRLAPMVTRNGVLIDVYGAGILLTGESGIGKSECALEMIKRGHRLVADDVVEIRRVTEGRLVGEAPEAVRYFMEIRGVGLIDVLAMYGVSAVIRSKSIEMVAQLELWDDQKDYTRLDAGDDFAMILGVKVPRLTIPVRPGRNLAIVVEVAARNYRLAAMGNYAARAVAERVDRLIRQSGETDIMEE